MATTLFSEDFQTRIDPDTQQSVVRCQGPGGAGTYPFPNGWLLRNVDNRSPGMNATFVNEAWEVREDFLLDNLNCVAFSTSWYSPSGAANDWMWTPLIGPLPANGAVLRWRAHSYDPDFPDGYEVRVMAAPNAPTGGTAAIGNQITNSTVVFSTAGETLAWTLHTVDLTAYHGQSIYIGFRNNSTDRFLLVIDDIEVLDVSTDLAAQAAPGFTIDYARVPAGISVNANYKVVAENRGTSTLTAVSASAQLSFNGSPHGSAATSGSVPSLASAASATLSFADPVVLGTTGTWGVTYTVSANETGNDSDPDNNVLQAAGTTIGGNEWARHERETSGVTGIGSGDGGEEGTTFTLMQTASFEGVRFGMGTVTAPSSWPGHSVVANLRSTDANGKPTAIIATTTPITSSFVGGVYDVRFVGGPQSLAPGKYFVGVVEPSGMTDPMPLRVSMQRFTNGTSWATWPSIPGGGWQTLESFGAIYARAPHVSLLSEVSLFKDDFEVHVDPPALHAVASPTSTTPATTRRPYAGTALAKPAR